MKRLFLLPIFFILLVLCARAEAACSKQLSDIQLKFESGKYWLLNENGDTLSSAYDSIEPFWNNVSIVSNDGKFGLLSITGQEMIPCAYDHMIRKDDCFVLEQQSDLGVFYGLSDNNGNILIPPNIYNEMAYENGMAVVAINGPGGGAGIIDRTGNVILPLVFERIAPFESGWAWVVEKESLQYNFINQEGEYFLDVFADDCSGFYGSFAVVRYGERHFVISADKRIYREIHGNRVDTLNIDGLFLVINENSQFVYNAYSDEYIPVSYHISRQGYHDGLIAVQDDAGKWGFMDDKLQIVIPCIFDAVQAFSNGRVWATIDQTYYFLDTEGNYRYSGTLTAACPFSDGLAAIKVDNLWGFIDGDGNVKCTPSIETDQSMLLFIDGYCDLLLFDPYAAIYINKDFEVFCEYDLWGAILEQ